MNPIARLRSQVAKERGEILKRFRKEHVKPVVLSERLKKVKGQPPEKISVARDWIGTLSGKRK